MFAILNPFLEAGRAYAAQHPDMTEWEQQMFDEDQLEFQNVLAESTAKVDASFCANNGTLRQVVGEAVQALEDAFRVFDDTLF